MKSHYLAAFLALSCVSQSTPVLLAPVPLAQPSPTVATGTSASLVEEAKEPDPVLPPRKIAKRRILIIGDSEACAVAPVVKLAKLPTDAVDVDCKGGTVVQYWGVGGNFRAALSRHPKPDVVLIFLGTNHYWQEKVPPVDPVLNIIKDRGFQCVWVGNTAVHGKSWEINGLIRAAVSPPCDYFDTEAANIPLYDGVHPNAEAALLWLQKVWLTIPLKYEEEETQDD